MSDPSSSSSSTPSSSIRLHSKLRFFALVRRFLRSKASHNGKSRPSDHKSAVKSTELGAGPGKGSTEVGGFEEIDDCLDLQRSVKKLHFGSWEEKEAAAVDIGRLASKEDVKTRKSIAELGVIPVLVEMMGSGAVSRRRAAVTALIELANGTFTNKALMLEAGILSKFPAPEEQESTLLLNEFAELILSLSSLPNPQFQFSLTRILPFILKTLESPTSTADAAAKQSCLSALFNLSAALETASLLSSNGAVSALLTLISTKPFAEKALATLGQMVVTASGKKAMEDSSAVPEGLIEVLTWDDRPKCQELSAYVLMILAYQSSAQREKMAQCGIVAALLELALLGTPLAQKRALKLLQWFKDEREAKMGPHSGPQMGRRLAIGSPINPREAQEGRRLIKDLVKQSLNKNMEMITRRANNVGGGSSKLKNLVVSTSSKSLPY
ncbi:unnamed protein product [Linum tenue]|uniref:ARM repeat superfamily protein n=2 Tax=Linum tenue TaxID=586396 RepID=A0AAV0RKX1_9ROSI|nr:unnamed protein product [Linum tenue]